MRISDWSAYVCSSDRFLVGLLRGGEAGFVDAVVDAPVDRLVDGVILAAGDGISNAGACSAEGGDLAITSGGFISNSGLLQAKGSLSIGALSDIAPDLINTGSILSNGGLNLSGGDMDNQGRMLTSETMFLLGASMAHSGTLQALHGASIDVGTLITSG